MFSHSHTMNRIIIIVHIFGMHLPRILSPQVALFERNGLAHGEFKISVSVPYMRWYDRQLSHLITH